MFISSFLIDYRKNECARISFLDGSNFNCALKQSYI